MNLISKNWDGGEGEGLVEIIWALLDRDWEVGLVHTHLFFCQHTSVSKLEANWQEKRRDK